MRKATVFALVVTWTGFYLCSCAKKKPEPESKPAQTNQRKTPEPTRPPATETLDDKNRRDALQKEIDRYNDHHLRFNAAGLSEKGKKLLSHLLNAARTIEELNRLQIHPKNLEWGKRIRAGGTRLERRVYRRNQMPWCTSDDRPVCCALRSLPPRSVGLHHWPKGMDDAEFKKISAAPNHKALLSPFTVVRRTAGGKYQAVPYAAFPLFAPRMKKVAAYLRAAAAQADHPSLRKFLLSRAQAFEAQTPFPYDDSDYHWIALKGKWEVTVGPYEVYKNPRQVKARFQMVIGIESPGVTAELNKFRTRLQELENQVAKLVGTRIYKARKLDPRISIRAVKVLMAAGDARSPAGATVAYHLPNRGKSVDEGLYKKVMLVNHSAAFKSIIEARARLVLDPSLAKFLSPRADILNVTFHEFAHGFGAHDEMKVRTSGGKMTTVRDALGPHNSLFEEEKADVLSLYLLTHMKRKRLINDNHLKTRYVSALMHIFGLLNYPLKGTYPRMVAIQLGWYMEKGAVTWNRKTGRFSMDFTKMPAAVQSLARKVAVIQLTGDRKGAEALVSKYIETIPATAGKKKPSYRLKPPLREAVDSMKNKFNKAGVKSVVLNYHVTGL